MKICKICKEEKPIDQFYKCRGPKDGRRYECAKCFYVTREAYMKSYRATHKKKLNARATAWYVGHKELMKNNAKIYRQSHKDERNRQDKRRRGLDINYHLSYILRGRLWKALKGYVKTGSAVRDLGCTLAELKIYLTSKFKDSMSWDNYGDWHTDHIKPLSSFDLTDRAQFLQACHYTNLQPLWAADNLAKHAKIST